MVKIIGSVHPAGEKGPYSGYHLTEDAVKIWSSEIKGTRSIFEHGKTKFGQKKIGEVVAGFVDEKTKHLKVVIELYEKTREGKHVIKLIRTGIVKGLSCGMKHIKLGDRDIPKIISNSIDEVSPTCEPDFPDALIDAIESETKKGEFDPIPKITDFENSVYNSESITEKYSDSKNKPMDKDNSQTQ